MKTYFRVLAFARPYHRYLPQYTVLAVLSIVFGLLNFVLLQPLFAVIFETKTTAELQALAEVKNFSLSKEYFESIFYGYLMKTTEQYGKSSALVYVSVIIIVSVFLSNLFTYFSNLILSILRADVIKKVRDKVFRNTTGLHLGFFSGERKGDIISRMTNDIQEIENTVVHSVKVLFREPVTIIAFLIALFSYSVQLTIFSLIFFPVMGGIISEIVKRLKKKAFQSQESLGKIVNLMDEVFSGMRIIKAFTARAYVNDLFQEETGRYKKINISIAKKNELASPVSQFLGVLVVAGLLVYGGNMVLSDQSEMNGEALFTYIIIFSQILNPVKSISQSLSGIQRGLASAERVFKLMDAQPNIQNAPKAIQKTDFESSITFDQVSFKYEKDEVLTDINFNLEKGKTIALVGPSGGGKSTLADLIPRFYDPTGGQILIDGVPLTNLEVDSVRKLLGIVTQESILFNDTVFKNIAFAMPEVTEEEVIRAAKIANAHEFITTLEEGYQTNIGERGAKLSGGQRQRLSIARAILKNPPVLILDEATSALDSESEKLVQEALTNLMKNRTSLVIAHRLSTIQHADEILVIQKGKIVEKGNHQTLMGLNGVYTKLISMQSI